MLHDLKRFRKGTNISSLDKLAINRISTFGIGARNANLPLNSLGIEEIDVRLGREGIIRGRAEIIGITITNGRYEDVIGL
jgi:hypothetical protein